MVFWMDWYRRSHYGRNKLPALNSVRKVSQAHLSLEPLEDRILLSTAQVLPLSPNPPAISVALVSTNNSEVELSSVYNRNAAIVTDGSTFASRSTGVDGNGQAYSSNLLGSSLTWNDVNFSFGAANTSNAVSCVGQTVTLPQGSYSSLSFLASTDWYNEPNITFTVHYTDGTQQTFTQSFSQWESSQNYSGESLVQSLPYLDVYNGTKKTETSNLYGYSFALDSSKQVQSITLPKQYNINIFAMTLTPASGTAPATANVSVSGQAPNQDIAGSQITYTLIVTNHSATAQNNITLTDLLPSQTTLVTWTSSAGWTGSAPAVGSSGTVTATGSLAADASATFTLVVQVPNSAAEGTVLSNAASLNPLEGETNTGTTTVASQTTVALVSANDSEVDLSSVYNRNAAIVTDGTTFASRSTGVDGNGQAYSSNLLGSSLTWNGVNFTFSAANTSNAVSCVGQTVTLPQGSYSSLSFLASTDWYNEPNITFTVHYTDGTQQTFTQSFSQWESSQNYSGESLVQSLPYLDVYNGTKKTETSNLYGYSFALDSSKQVQSITLPKQYNITIFAMTVSGTVATNAPAILAQQLYNAGQSPAAIAQTLEGISSFTHSNIASGIAQVLYNAGQSPNAIAQALWGISGLQSSDVASGIAWVLTNAGQSPTAIAQTLAGISGLLPSDIAQGLYYAGESPATIAQAMAGISGLQPSDIAYDLGLVLYNAGQSPATIAQALEGISGVQPKDVAFVVALGITYPGQSPAAIAQVLDGISGLQPGDIAFELAQNLDNAGQSPAAIFQTLNGISGLQPSDIAAGLVQVLDLNTTWSAVAQTLEGISGLQPSDIAFGISQVMYNDGQSLATIIQTLEGISGLQPTDIATGIIQVLYNTGQSPAAIAQTLNGISGLSSSAIAIGIAQVLYGDGQTPADIAQTLDGISGLEPSDMVSSIAQVLFNAGRTPAAIVQALEGINLTESGGLFKQKSLGFNSDSQQEIPSNAVAVSAYGTDSVVALLSDGTLLLLDPGASAPTVLAPNISISSFEIEPNSGDIVALTGGNLMLITPDTAWQPQLGFTTQTLIATGNVFSFVAQNNGNILALEVGNILAVITPGALVNPTTAFLPVTSLEDYGSGGAVALQGGDLLFFNSNSSVPTTVASNVSSFLVQDNGNILALEGSTFVLITPGVPGSSTIASNVSFFALWSGGAVVLSSENLLFFSADSSEPTTLASDVSSCALASGSIVALSGTNLEWFWLGSSQANVTMPNVSSFLVVNAAAGSVAAFEPNPNSGINTLGTFLPWGSFGTVVVFGSGGKTTEASLQNVGNMVLDAGNLYALSVTSIGTLNFPNNAIMQLVADNSWVNVTPADDITSMAVAYGQLYALSGANHNIWWDVGSDAGGTVWDNVTPAPNFQGEGIAAMAGDSMGGTIYALDYGGAIYQLYYENGWISWTQTDLTLASLSPSVASYFQEFLDVWSP